MMKQVGIKFDTHLLAAIDQARGKVPRQRWIARACEQALGAGEAKLVPAAVPAPEVVAPRAKRSGPKVAPNRAPGAGDMMCPQHRGRITSPAVLKAGKCPMCRSALVPMG